MDVRVFERREDARSLGAGVVCWPNASFVLSEFGLLGELRGVSGRVSAMRRFSQAGEELGGLDLGRLDSEMGFPSLAVLRQDLMRLLLRRADELGVRVEFGACATGVDGESPHGCRVRYSDGSEAEADIVIGADGRMNSVARAYVLGDNRPVYQGCVNWLGVYDGDPGEFEAAEIHDYWGVGARFGVVPVSSNKAYWAGGFAAPEGPAARPDELNAVFADWPPLVKRIISSAASRQAQCLGLYDHDPPTTWNRGRVLMIGDAAHAALPTSGQGVAQALEDAWLLARELEACPDDPTAAFANFIPRRQKKTAGITLGARGFASSLFCSDAEACARRDRDAARTDYDAMAIGMATGWSAGLPIGPA
ncbi:FAD-dependent urate hydroxylase [Pseudobythopirellula maris]|uniref:FAD-dependent urate hydroxylase n=2 Tax=Pseudobythopirellula maris TaxID=2527991 RepID=A0A5C5ZGJ3_9BACT|nr:FAD-dependent urate hydroxylase [Pseudobythopirellula maris]